MRAARPLLLLSLAITLLPACEGMQLSAPIGRLQEACAGVDPACRKEGTLQSAVEKSTKVLQNVEQICDGLDTGSAICMLKLKDLADVMGQVRTLAGGWQSIGPYPYACKKPKRVQVATARTRYWVGARDNKGGVYISQSNENLVCGSTKMIPEGMEVSAFLEATKGTAGETKEDLICEKLYPTHPLALGTYTSMCVSTGRYEGDGWKLNTEADEACIRSFMWRTDREETRQVFRKALTRYIMRMAVNLDLCTVKPSTKHKSHMHLQCGSKVTVFKDELVRM